MILTKSSKHFLKRQSLVLVLGKDLLSLRWN